MPSLQQLTLLGIRIGEKCQLLTNGFNPIISGVESQNIFIYIFKESFNPIILEWWITMKMSIPIFNNSGYKVFSMICNTSTSRGCNTMQGNNTMYLQNNFFPSFNSFHFILLRVRLPPLGIPPFQQSVEMYFVWQCQDYNLDSRYLHTMLYILPILCNLQPLFTNEIPMKLLHFMYTILPLKHRCNNLVFW